MNGFNRTTLLSQSLSPVPFPTSQQTSPNNRMSSPFNSVRSTPPPLPSQKSAVPYFKSHANHSTLAAPIGSQSRSSSSSCNITNNTNNSNTRHYGNSTTSKSFSNTRAAAVNPPNMSPQSFTNYNTSIYSTQTPAPRALPVQSLIENGDKHGGFDYDQASTIPINMEKWNDLQYSDSSNMPNTNNNQKNQTQGPPPLPLTSSSHHRSKSNFSNPPPLPTQTQLRSPPPLPPNLYNTMKINSPSMYTTGPNVPPLNSNANVSNFSANATNEIMRKSASVSPSLMHSNNAFASSNTQSQLVNKTHIPSTVQNRLSTAQSQHRPSTVQLSQQTQQSLSNYTALSSPQQPPKPKSIYSAHTTTPTVLHFNQQIPNETHSTYEIPRSPRTRAKSRSLFQQPDVIGQYQSQQNLLMTVQPQMVQAQQLSREELPSLFIEYPIDPNSFEIVSYPPTPQDVESPLKIWMKEELTQPRYDDYVDSATNALVLALTEDNVRWHNETQQWKRFMPDLETQAINRFAKQQQQQQQQQQQHKFQHQQFQNQPVPNSYQQSNDPSYFQQSQSPLSFYQSQHSNFYDENFDPSMNYQQVSY